MSDKMIPRPERLRRAPSGFGWVDHRFVRHGYSARLGSGSLALYLFMVTVANEDGLSWYSSEKLCLLTGLDDAGLQRARRELEAQSLIAFSRPVYQVLELPALAAAPVIAVPPPAAGPVEFARLGDTFTIQEVMHRLTTGGQS